MRTFDWNLDNVHVRNDGRILWDGEQVGTVAKNDPELSAMGKWRAEIGDPASLHTWPPYRVCYAQTRKAAVDGVLDGVQVPE